MQNKELRIYGKGKQYSLNGWLKNAKERQTHISVLNIVYIYIINLLILS